MNGRVTIDWVLKTLTYYHPTGYDTYITMYGVFNSPTDYVDGGTTINFDVPCYITTICSQTLGTPTDYQIQYSMPHQVVVLQFPMHDDTEGRSYSSPMKCGAKTYTSSVTWAGVIPPGNPATENFSLWINTNDYGLAGTQGFTLTVGFAFT